MKIPQSRTLKLFLLFSAVSLWSIGCSDNSTGTDGDGDGDGDGNGNTEPPAATYSNVQSIFNSNCTTSGCHDAQSASSGVILSSYDNTMNSVGDQYGKKIVIPDSASASPLVDKIESNPEFGNRMPAGGPFLSTEQINLIKEWINNGAENN